MYYPLCYLIPNYGPCVRQNQNQYRPELRLQVTSHFASNAAVLAEESSASKYKAMLRSIYSSNSAASSRSAALAAMSTSHAETAEYDGDDNGESDADELQELDASNIVIYGSFATVIAAALALLM